MYIYHESLGSSVACKYEFKLKTVSVKKICYLQKKRK